MRPFLKTTYATIVAMALLGTVASVRAEDHKPKSETPPTPEAPAKTKRESLPFHGKLAAVDKSASTITLKGKETNRVFQITPATKIIKTGKPASLDDATVGEDVGGSYKKTESGNLEALSLRIGPKPEKEKKEKSEKKAE